MNTAWASVPVQTACNKNVSDVSKSRLAPRSQWMQQWCNPPTAASLASTHLLGLLTHQMWGSHSLQNRFPCTVGFRQIKWWVRMCWVDQSAIKVPIKDSFHVLKTTEEAPRWACTEFSFPCSCMSSLHVRWMAEQTDDSAKKLSVFDFAQRTQSLTFLLEFFFFPPPLPDCYGVLFQDW